MQRGTKSYYRRLMLYSVLILISISLIPLIVMTVVNYYEYKSAFTKEMQQAVHESTYKTKRSLEYFLNKRKSALSYIANDSPFSELADSHKLERIAKNLRNSFSGFADLNVIDSEGNQCSYAGSFDLGQVNYRKQDWFEQVKLKGLYISDVFLGFHKIPHFVIAVKHEMEDGTFFILRATVDVELLADQIRPTQKNSYCDSFVLNQQGIMQTACSPYGKVLEPSTIPVPPLSEEVVELEMKDDSGKPSFIMGYSSIAESPFIFVMIKKYSPETMGNWFGVRGRLILFLSISIIVIVVIVQGTALFLVSRVRESDLKHDAAMHQIEYTNKMASIGRLAAGVAHEINNPLAIINEKAGLIKDLTATGEGGSSKEEKYARLADAIIKSVKRCSKITHSLLGFAKRMQVQTEGIDLENVIREVLVFLEKEALFRNIHINFDIAEDMPTIVSDRGKLEQVFLNIINNAFAAMEDNGRLDIAMRNEKNGEVSVVISDNGRGISEKDLKRIFDPFFTTKDKGVGLGLSITYGIVEKLGGKIVAESTVGKGTHFTVTLPVKIHG